MPTRTLGATLLMGLVAVGACHPSSPAPARVESPPMTTRDHSPQPPTIQPPTVQPPTVQPPTVQPPTVTADPRAAVDLRVPDEVAAVREAHARVLAPGAVRVVVLLAAGPGARAEALRQRLRAALSSDARVTLAVATVSPGAPVADPGDPGGHVNTVAALVTPRPDVVVGASEHDGTLYVVGSDPGPDGLGAGADGRRWVIHFSALGGPATAPSTPSSAR
jgi:hypothetical protein